MKKDIYLLKQKIIKNLWEVQSWLEKNINKEDTLNKLYYIILIYIIIDKEKNKNINQIYLSKNTLKIKKNIDKKKFILSFFQQDNNIEKLSKILLYDKKINYLDKIKEKKDLYFTKYDLEIRFLPNFLNYDFVIILMWICFCVALNKKNTSYSTYFLHDIYLFQNSNNNIEKISILITIIGKIINYIQFFDYEK